MNAEATAETMNGSGWRAVHGLVFVALFAAATAVPVLRIWPFLWLAPLAAYAAFVAVVPPLRQTYRPLRFGRASKPAVLAALVIGVGSSAVLMGFHFLTHPD